MFLLKLLLVATLAYVTNAADSYGLVIDAGSSGSRIWCFRWSGRNFETLPIPVTTPIQVVGFSSKTTPGVSTAQGRTNLVSLLNYAEGKLGALGVSFSSVPIFLKGKSYKRYALT